jgi:hypothetical protein
MPRNPDKKPCQIPDCRAWAVRGTDPPLCASHAGRAVGAPLGNQNRTTHGFYASGYRSDEIDDLATCAPDTTLDDEIVLIRVALRRLLIMLLTGFTPKPNPQPLSADDYARFIGLSFQGSRAVGYLLRIRSTLPEFAGGGMLPFIGEALDELSAEWGVDL